MLISRFRYTIGHFSVDGECLGGVPFEPDWAPAEECVRFSALRKGHALATLEGSVEPVWSRAGAPYLHGIRVALLDEAESFSEEFTVDYFAPSARQTFRKVSRSSEEPKESTLLFVVTAVPDAAENARISTGRRKPATRVTANRRLEDGSFPPDARAVSRALGATSDYPVFIETAVMKRIEVQVLENPERETGGILGGSLLRSSEAGDVFAIVNAHVPAPFTEADETRLRFTPESWAALRAERGALGGGVNWLGWYHSHPGHKVQFFSQHDVHLHRTVFMAAHQVALVATHTAGAPASFRLYGWRNGLIAARSFSLYGGDVRRTADARVAFDGGWR